MRTANKHCIRFTYVCSVTANRKLRISLSLLTQKIFIIVSLFKAANEQRKFFSGSILAKQKKKTFSTQKLSSKRQTLFEDFHMR